MQPFFSQLGVSHCSNSNNQSRDQKQEQAEEEDKQCKNLAIAEIWKGEKKNSRMNEDMDETVIWVKGGGVGAPPTPSPIPPIHTRSALREPTIFSSPQLSNWTI